jgi:hypothetical protein
MRQASPTPFRSNSLAANPGEIAWEELPSLAGVLREHLAARNVPRDTAEPAHAPRPGASVWDETVPAPLSTEPEKAPAPFLETLNGLATRELSEPDVFEHFFGRLKVTGA